MKFLKKLKSGYNVDQNQEKCDIWMAVVIAGNFTL